MIGIARSLRSRRLLLLSLVLVWPLIGNGIAAAQTVQVNRDTVVLTGPAQNEAEIAEYWTPERMRAAIPVPVPVGRLVAGKAPSPARGGGGGKLFIAPPQLPAGSVTPAAEVPLALAQPVSNPGSWPYSAIGKVFFRGTNGVDYVCSGAAVSGSDRTFLTAAHCLYSFERKTWNQYLTFCPSYTPAGCPKMFYTNYWSVISANYHSNGDLAYDIGGAQVTEDMFTGRGNLGIVFNAPYNNGPWSDTAYPAEAPFPGNQMYQATGNYVGGSQSTGIGMGNNDMKGGASGGPWLVTYGGIFGYTNGNQSFIYPSIPNQVYSPYYGDAAHSVWYCAVSKNCS